MTSATWVAPAPRVQVSAESRARVTRPDVALFGLPDTDVALAVRSFDPIRSAVADAQQQFNRLDADQNGYLDRDDFGDTEIDDILDEIDGVLETNAEEFVRGFVQKGGQ